MAGVPRVICWFSCGDASAVATALALKQYRAVHEVVVARIVIPSEHPDNDRFADECAEWFGQEMVNLRSTEYKDTWDVWEKRRYIAGIAGAPCTANLKKAVRYEFQRPTDIHIFGYAADEKRRAEEFRKTNFDLTLDYPLIGAQLTKADCHGLVRAKGIELPMMYRLGFHNNNCIGCPKGGAGYWNRIRIHFPETFRRMAELSRRLGARLVRQDGARIFLDELRPDTGRMSDLLIDCSPFCETAAGELGFAQPEPVN